MRRSEIPPHYEMVQDSPVVVVRDMNKPNPKEYKYRYFIDGEGLSATEFDSIEDATKFYFREHDRRSDR